MEACPTLKGVGSGTLDRSVWWAFGHECGLECAEESRKDIKGTIEWRVDISICKSVLVKLVNNRPLGPNYVAYDCHEIGFRSKCSICSKESRKRKAVVGNGV